MQNSRQETGFSLQEEKLIRALQAPVPLSSLKGIILENIQSVLGVQCACDSEAEHQGVVAARMRLAQIIATGISRQPPEQQAYTKQILGLVSLAGFEPMVVAEHVATILRKAPARNPAVRESLPAAKQQLRPLDRAERRLMERSLLIERGLLKPAPGGGG